MRRRRQYIKGKRWRDITGNSESLKLGFELEKEGRGQTVMLEIYITDCLQLLLLAIAQIENSTFTLISKRIQKERWKSNMKFRHHKKVRIK